MQTSKHVYERPESELQQAIDTQKSIRVKRLDALLAPILWKLVWQDQALLNNVKTIRKLNDRAQRAEEKLKRANRRLAEYERSERYEHL